MQDSKKEMSVVAILWSLFLVYTLFFHVEQIPSQWVNFGETYRLTAIAMLGSVSLALWVIVLLPDKRRDIFV